MYGGGLEKQIAYITDIFAKYDSNIELLLWNDDPLNYDTSMTIINLEKKFGSKTLVSKIRKYLFIKHYIKKNGIDTLIDYRHRKKPWLEVFLSNFIYHINVFYTVQNSKLSTYGFKNKWLVKYIYNKNKHLVCVSKSIAEHIKLEFPYLKNVHTIHNLVIENKSESNLKLDFDYILYAGRIDAEVKQVDKLIQTYKQSKVYNDNIHLLLLGWDGKNQALHELVEKLNLKKFIHFYEFQKDIQPFYKQALFTVLCSQNEGLPVVLLESLINETPVISFDCPTGPSEVIQHEINGLLIENQNFDDLKMAIQSLLNDRKKLNFLKSNAKKSVAPFSKESILKKWLELINAH